MKVIAPCCGSSKRFPDMPPKWMLPAHDGRPMLTLALGQIDFDLDDLLVTILREHEERFQITKGLAQAFGRPVRTVVLDEPTRSQSETVAKTLEVTGLNEPFLVKDSDNVFALNDVEQDTNYICTESLNNFDSINPRNKSYLQVDGQGFVVNIREKVVISDTFNVGGYFFRDPRQFLDVYRRLTAEKTDWTRELYLSDIIGAMLLAGVPFRARQVTSYQDWGTVHEWRQALLGRKAYIVSLDGFLFERGSEYFAPRFEEAKPHEMAVEAVKALAEQGHTIIYATIRPQRLEQVTVQQLRAMGLATGPILWECPIAQWVVVTAPHSTLPFQTSRAMEVDSNDPNLGEKLLGNVY